MTYRAFSRHLPGSSTSQFTLGVMYANGTGVAQSDEQAVEWYRKAANQGLASAQTNLGARYFSGRGVRQDPAQAVLWFHKAAELADASALFNLGVLYANGSGVAPDAIEAYKWLSLAVDRSFGAEQKGYAEARDTVAGPAVALMVVAMGLHPVVGGRRPP